MLFIKSIKNKLWRVKKAIKNSLLERILPYGFYFSQKGYCPCCDNKVTFKSKSHWLRDFFVCDNCNSIPRERALMLVIEKYYPNWKDIDIH